MKDILNNNEFANMLMEHSLDILEFILENDSEFSIVVKKDLLDFTPSLPEEIKLPDELILFTLANYTLQSAVLEDDKLQFEAGFGEDDFATLVSIPLEAIVQIIDIDNKILFINLSDFKHKKEPDNKEKSKQIFMSNPKNKNFFNQ